MNECKTCAHPRRKEIDLDLRANQMQLSDAMSLSSIAEKYGVTKSSLFRHQKSGHHLQTETAGETILTAKKQADLLHLSQTAKPEKELDSTETAHLLEYTNITQVFARSLPFRVKQDLLRQAREKGLPPPRFTGQGLNVVTTQPAPRSYISNVPAHKRADDYSHYIFERWK